MSDPVTINRYEATVSSCAREDGFAWLDVGGGRLAARLWPGIRKGEQVIVHLRPEDVVLCTEPPEQVSTRNVLSGTVARVRAFPDAVAVTLDVGFPLVAYVTRRTVREMGLAAGRPIVALAKATAVVPEADVAPRFTVGVVGPHGEIPARCLALLRLVHATGSLSAAARARAITYRTAWLWVRDANAAWGRPLVEPTQGGAGGGGATLTPEALALLESVAEREAGPAPTDAE